MTDTQKPVAWVDKRQWEEFSLASWPTHLPAHNVGGDDRTGLYTADQLDAAVRAERERCARLLDAGAKNAREALDKAIADKDRRAAIDFETAVYALVGAAAAIREGE